MEVPGWVYKRMALGEISPDEVEQLEKMAMELSKEAKKKLSEEEIRRAKNMASVGAAIPLPGMAAAGAALGAPEGYKGQAAMGGFGGGSLGGVAGALGGAALGAGLGYIGVPKGKNLLIDPEMGAIAGGALGGFLGGTGGRVMGARKGVDYMLRKEAKAFSSKEYNDTINWYKGQLKKNPNNAAMRKDYESLVKNKSSLVKEAYYGAPVSTMATRADATDQQLKNRNVQLDLNKGLSTVGGGLAGGVGGAAVGHQLGGARGALLGAGLGAIGGALGSFGQNRFQKAMNTRTLDARARAQEKQAGVEESTGYTKRELAELGGGAALTGVGIGSIKAGRKRLGIPLSVAGTALGAKAMLSARKRNKKRAEKTASVSPMGRAGANAAVADKSNNLHRVMKAVPSKDRDDVLRALRQMKKQASSEKIAFGARGASTAIGALGGAAGGAMGGGLVADAYDMDPRGRLYAMGGGALAGAVPGAALGRYYVGPAMMKSVRAPSAATEAAFERARDLGAAGMVGGGLLAGVGGGFAGKGIRDRIDAAKEASSYKVANMEQAMELMEAHGLSAIEALQQVYPEMPDEQIQEMARELEAIQGNKEASSLGPVGQAGMILGGAALAPVVGHLAMRGVNRLMAKSPAQQEQDLRRILEVHPDIGRPEDPRVQMAYASLTKLNPSYAEDPLIAGPLLKQIVDSRMNPADPTSASYVDPGIAKNLSEARKAVREGDPRNTLGDQMGQSMFSGTNKAVNLFT